MATFKRIAALDYKTRSHVPADAKDLIKKMLVTNPAKRLGMLSGAEKDIFPHLSRRNPAVIAYTATRWRKLLKRPRGWDGAVPTAGDCYRFCLSSPHVNLVLHGPATMGQFNDNLAAMSKGALSEEEERWMRAFGAVVHG